MEAQSTDTDADKSFDEIPVMEAQSIDTDADKSFDEIPVVELDTNDRGCLQEISWFRLPEYELSYNAMFTTRGSKQFHFYLWVLKDLSWAQSWYYSGNAFGILAVIWAGLLLFDSFREGNINEMATGVAVTLWYAVSQSNPFQTYQSIDDFS